MAGGVETLTCRLKTYKFIKSLSVFGHWSVSTISKRFLAEPFATKFEFICITIIVSNRLDAGAQLFGTANNFF